MKKLLKIILPSVFLLAFGIASMTVILSCSKDDGSKCSSCDYDSDCDSGLYCYPFSDGKDRCAESSSTICSKI